jgi:hypothetical protein
MTASPRRSPHKTTGLAPAKPVSLVRLPSESAASASAYSTENGAENRNDNLDYLINLFFLFFIHSYTI